MRDPRSDAVRTTLAMPDDDTPVVAVLGAIGPDKGARRLERLVELTRERGLRIRWVLIGYLDRGREPWQSADGVFTMHGPYDVNMLPALIEHYRVRLVAYPSAGPETFSFTLSEVWALGRPAIVPPVGALADRVGASGGGWVWSEEEWRSEERMLDRIARVLDPDAARRVRRGIRARTCSAPDDDRRDGDGNGGDVSNGIEKIDRRNGIHICADRSATLRRGVGLCAVAPAQAARYGFSRIDRDQWRSRAHASSLSEHCGADIDDEHDRNGARRSRAACSRGASHSSYADRKGSLPTRARVLACGIEGPLAAVIGAGYSEWLARGQTQQSAGRLVDALLCYRAALEANRYSVQAQFHLGEVLERLGRSSEAFEAWRAALTLQPRHVAALMAFGAAARHVGNPQEAAEAFRRALAIEPQNAAAARGLGLARLALGDATVYADFGALFLGAVGDKTIDAAMHDLARLLAAAPASTERTGLLAEIETIQDAELPPLLLALLAEHALSEGADARALSWLARAAEEGATSAIDDPEALRRLAIVAGRQADAETDRAASSLPRSWATAWATQYAQRCAALHAPKIPLLWPRRLAGASLRIAYLIDLDRPLKIGAVIVDAARFVADVAATHSPDRIVASVYTVGRREDARAVATGDSSGFTTTHLGPSPDRAVAQMLADADLDALVDLAGMAATSAALLAQRPARTVWTPAALFAAHVAPLVTHQLPAPASGESEVLPRTDARSRPRCSAR